MSSNKKVLIFGRSLNLAGIGACLMLNKVLNVEFIDLQDPGFLEYLSEINSDVILFDLGNPPSVLNFRLLQRQPGLLLIGVDPISNDVLIFRSQHSQVMSTDDLNQLISYQTNQPVFNGV